MKNAYPLPSRRTVLGTGVAAAAMAALAACTSNPTAGPSAVTRIMPGDPMIADFEARRTVTGKTVTTKLTAGEADVVIAGQPVRTWGYGGTLNGPVIRATAGDKLTVPLMNKLSQGTSVHWHGLALRNDQDGVPGLTQQAIAPGAAYDYNFVLPHPGTYWYHSHVEMQRERGLYGALIIADPKETLAYDQEWVIILDDWMDGVTGTPDDVLKELSMGMGSMNTPAPAHSMPGMDMGGGSASSMPGMDMGGSGSTMPPMPGMKYMLMGARSDFLGGDAGDVSYPYHLFNGKAAAGPETFPSKPGSRVRLRIINAAADTAYRVGVPGQKITLTHTDGFPAAHRDVDAVVLGMGERIDAILNVQEGFTPVLALPEGKPGMAYGLVSTGTGTPPPATAFPSTLGGTVVDGGMLKADASVLLPAKPADRVHEVHLTGGMAKYDWGINNRRFDMNNPYEGAFDLKVNERVRVDFINDTTMWHPMHLHGHTFQLAGGGARKDTVIVRPKQTVSVEFDADNPGQWLTHCHNAYHAERGMMGVFSYIK